MEYKRGEPLGNKCPTRFTAASFVLFNRFTCVLYVDLCATCYLFISEVCSYLDLISFWPLLTSSIPFLKGDSVENDFIFLCTPMSVCLCFALFCSSVALVSCFLLLPKNTIIVRCSSCCVLRLLFKKIFPRFQFCFFPFSYLFMMKRPFWVSTEFRGPFETGTFFFFSPNTIQWLCHAASGLLNIKEGERKKKAFSCASVSLSSSSLSVSFFFSTYNIRVCIHSRRTSCWP